MEHTRPVLPEDRGVTIHGAFAEYYFYACLAYAMTSKSLGIDAPGLGVALFAISVVLSQMSSGFRTLRMPCTVLAVLTSCIYVVMQFVIHGLPPSAQYVKPIVLWPLMVLAVTPLLFRRGFLHRLSVVMLAIIIIQLPAAYHGGGVVRLLMFTPGQTGVDNPNGLAAWLAFCAVCQWLAFWRETGLRRLASATAFSVAVLVMLQCVSRGTSIALPAGLLSATFALPKRRRLRHLLVLGLIGIAIMTGSLFTQTRTRFRSKSPQSLETGRAPLFITAWRGFASAPLTGQGAYQSPHNPFALIAVASGVIPLISFCLLWILSFRSALRAPPQSKGERLTLLVYAFAASFFSNLNFTVVWAVAAVGYAWTSTDLAARSRSRNLRVVSEFSGPK
jgi:hypothetical protein